ncbi:MFS transporter [Pseudomonas sp. 5P_3.1_Bac2]|uniref:MFS transporter n=1 Tax=Pseudomonas sp. 5P_3.1_Bac2 TaxID=2971617 RepID=UPI0021C91DC8|nr:MFS transporter [Pseudomonas sp. 5P_3.1_Bac2]MCU1717141.1 MFS transporter [Pseudomonas sp. 5P_3.1_Bac2]
MTSVKPSAHASGYRWVVLFIATLAQASACFFVQGIGAIALFVQQDLQLSNLQIGLLMSAAQLLPILGLLVAGELLDRYQERWVVGIGTLLVGFALCLSMLANSYWALLSCLLVVGAAYSTAQPGGSKSVASWFGPKQRGFAMGIRQAGLPLGGALAAAALPAIALHWGWRWGFLAGGLIALLGGLLFIALYRAATPDKPAGAAPSLGINALLRARLAMLGEPAMGKIMLSGISLVSVQYGILIFTALYLYERLGLSISAATTLLVIAQGAGVVGRIVLAAWGDHSKAGRYFPVLTCLLAVIIGLSLLLLAPLQQFWALALLLAWLGFFGFGWYGPWVAYVADSAPADKTGFALGLAMAVNQVAIVLVPPALGWLRDLSHSYVPGWLILIALSLLALLLSGGKTTKP